MKQKGVNTMAKQGFKIRDLASTEIPTNTTPKSSWGNRFNGNSGFAFKFPYDNTTIKFELPRASQVNLSVYDILGREVSVLLNERKDAGVHEVKFDGSNLASGVYFYRLKAGDFVAMKRLLLLK
jgi:hypothetical protein